METANMLETPTGPVYGGPDLETITPAELLLWRRGARKSFAVFCQFMMPDHTIGAHIDLIRSELQAVGDGKCKRLLLTMPPRHRKSAHASQLFPCWMLGRNPKMEIVVAGYAAEIALEHSRKARAFYLSDRFLALFPEVRRPGQSKAGIVQTAHEWWTPQRGRYYAVGIGGGLTGRGADLAIFDDPVKDREEAESERYRNRAFDWYTSTLGTRLSSGAAIVGIQTRWHVDDLAGRILQNAAEGTGEIYKHINLPAIDPTGKTLWPERFSAQDYAQMRLRAGTRDWEALYQGEPTIQGGNFFAVDRLRYDALADFPEVQYIRCWDPASTEKQVNKNDPDYTAGALVALTMEQGEFGPLPHLWIKDIRAGQWEPNKRNAEIERTAMEDGAAVPIFYEAVGAYKDSAATMAEALKGKRMFTPHHVSSDKMVRASPLQPIFDGGNVHVPRGAAWLPIFEKQFTEFPAGSHDDVVDAVATARNKLDTPLKTKVISLSGVGR